MGNSTVNAVAASSTEVISTEAAPEKKETDQSPGFFKRAAAHLAKSLKEAVNFATNHKLAVASLIVTTILAGPIAGTVALTAALFLESAWAALRQKGQKESGTEQQPPPKSNLNPEQLV